MCVCVTNRVVPDWKIPSDPALPDSGYPVMSGQIANKSRNLKKSPPPCFSSNHIDSCLKVEWAESELIDGTIIVIIICKFSLRALPSNIFYVNFTEYPTEIRIQWKFSGTGSRPDIWKSQYPAPDICKPDVWNNPNS